MLDVSGRPQSAYREFMNQSKAKGVLAARLRAAYDDLFAADKEAHTKSNTDLKGWFKTKTGVSDAVAEKIATTFKSLASYADFSGTPAALTETVLPTPSTSPQKEPAVAEAVRRSLPETGLAMIYRLEIHLPETQNMDTYRAIFRALREELMP